MKRMLNWWVALMAVVVLGVQSSLAAGTAATPPGSFAKCPVISYAEKQSTAAAPQASSSTNAPRRLLSAAPAQPTIERSWVVRSPSSSNVTYAVKQTLNAATGGEISMCAYSPNRVLATLSPGKRYADFEAEMTSKGFRVVRELMKDLQGNSVYVIESTDTEHDVVEQMTMGIQSTGFCSQIRPDHIFSANVVPNDGKWADQWNMVKIGAPKAWNTRTDASSVLVAVLDTGVNFNHYDLNQNLWLNAVESADMGNGEDDDGNGIVDDVYGIASDGGNVSGNPMDENGHGSHCAGIIGAVGNNRYGVAGVAWKAKIMGLKFLDAGGHGCASDAITCLVYAAQKGVKIVNCSFGSMDFNNYLFEQIQIMVRQGVIFVCAAGNASNGSEPQDNDIRPFYPANHCMECSNIVVVAATDRDDDLASFSYYGAQNVHIAAPGVDIESSVLGSMAYDYMSGTSMATPHVTGALALLMAEHPDESPSAIIERLFAAGEEIPALKGKVRTGKRLSLTNFFGLPAPSAVTASQGTIQDAVGLYWTAVANATHYRVWRAEAADANKTPLTDWMQGLTFSDETALAGSNYWYFVQAAASAEGADASAYSEGVPGFRPEIPENRVTVTFNANGGTVAEPKRNYTAGDTYGEFPTATYSDRVFLGWHTAATGGTRVDDVSVVRQDVTTLYAHWSGADDLRVENLAAQQRYPWNGKVDVMFDLNGVPEKEYASLALTAKDEGEAQGFALATYDGNAPTNLSAGSHRVIWNADADKPNALFENLTLSATASIDVPRAPASGTASNNVAAGGIDLAWTAAHGASSYEIWRSTSSTLGSAAKLLDCAELTCLDGSCAMGTYYYYWIKSKSSGGTSPDALALEARRGPPLPVALAITGNTTVRAGSSITLTAMATYNDGTSKTVTPNWSITSGSSYGSINSSGTFTANGTATQRTVTVKASYTENDVTVTATITITITTYTITVTFNGNNGTPSSQTQSYTAYGTYGSFPSVSWTGYNFAGWYTASSGGSQVVTSSAVPSANTTLYAHWSAIVPSAPTSVNATDGSSTANVTISWSAVSGATSYYVYRYTSNSSSSATQIGSTSSTSYNDTTATPGVTYYYWVKAYRSDNGQYSAFSSSNTGYRKLSAPTNVSATDGTYTDRVTVSWNSETGADKYYVYRYTSNSSGSAAQLGSTSSTSYTDTTASPGVTYYYWVKAYANSSSSYSDFSSSNTGYAQKALTSLTINGPAALDAGTNATYTCTATYSDNSTATVTPSWSITDGSSYASINSSGKLTANASTVDRSVTIYASYSDNGTATATKTITIRKVIPLSTALDNTDLVFTTGGNSNWVGVADVSYDGTDSARSGTIGHNQSTWLQTTVTGPGTLSFRWKVSSETSCDTLSFSVDDSSKASISGTSMTSFEQKTFDIATGTHTLKWTYKKDGSADRGSDCGWVDAVVYTRIYAPSAPTGVSATDNRTNDVTVTWSAVSGATSYQVWRSPYSYSPDSYATNIATSTSTSYVDTTVPAGSTYYYYVKAVNAAGMSGWSSCDGGYRVRAITGISLEGPEALPSGCSGAYRMKLSYSDGTQSGVTSSSYVTWSIPTNEFAEVSSSYTSDSEHGYYRYLTAKTVTSLKQVVVTAKYSYNGTTVTGTLTVSITPPGNLAYSYCLWPDGTGSLTGYLGSDKTTVTSLSLPSSINGVTIRGTTGSWMQNLSSLTSVTIPSTFGKVSDRMFYNCDRLTNVSIPNSVTNIEYRAFYDCDALQSITLPNSIKTIEGDAFYSCNNLQSVTLPNGLLTIGSQAFYYCIALKQMTIPSSVKTIGSYAFSSCSTMTQIIIPDSVTSISLYAFSGCSSLSSITIPDSVKSLSYAFEYCYGLKTVSLPDSLTSIDAYSFYMCTNLTAITVGSNNTTYKDVDGVLFNKSGTTLVKYPDGKAGSYTVPSGTTTIGQYAFCYSPKITSLTIPASVTSINNNGSSTYGIYNCAALQSISVNSSNPNYRSVDGVLYNKNMTTLVAYPGGKTATAFVMPDSVRANSEHYGSANLTNFVWSDSIGTVSAMRSICADFVKIPNSAKWFNYSSACATMEKDIVFPASIKDTTFYSYSYYPGWPGASRVFWFGDFPYVNCYSGCSVYSYGANCIFPEAEGWEGHSISTGYEWKRSASKVLWQNPIYALEIDGENKVFAGLSIPLYAKGFFSSGHFGIASKASWMVVSGSAYASINPSNGTFTAKGDVTTTRNISVYAETTLGGAYASAGQYNVQIVPANTNKTVLAFGKYAYNRLRWLPVANAVKYNIRRGTSSSYGSASIIDTYLKETLDGTETYVDSSASLNTTYYYWVEALDANGNSINVSDYAMAARATGDLTYVKDVLTKLYNGTYTESSFVTDAEKGILKEINYWNGVNSSWVNYIRTGSLTSISGANEMFWRSMYDLNTYIGIVMTEEAPSISSVTAASSSSVTVTWTPKLGATSYYLYRGTSANSSSATKIATVSGTSYTDTSSHSTGTQYYYWVKAVTPVGTTDFGVGDAYMPYSSSATYLVVDLSAGSSAASYPVSSLNAIPDGAWSDSYKTTKLVLRRIANGTYTMGCETTETGYYGYEAKPHSVTISKPFYMGIFEVTQKQYELVMGSNPSSYKGDARPVEYVSYNTIRGSSNGAKWPSTNSVDSTSFMGKIRARTGLTFDLPTEAQWEYACRAGTTTALNSGKNLTSTSSDANMAEVGRYCYNQSDGKGGYSSAHTTVGSYLPNNWGLYDMHGNGWEWCLDWYVSRGTSGFDTGAVTDPKGASSGSGRVYRGGGGISDAYNCRSACRYDYNPSYGSNNLGFRLSMTLP